MRTNQTYDQLTRRWTKLRYHPVQSACFRSTARFNINHSGRRSGKTELLGKRKPIQKALYGAMTFPDWRCFIGAPVRHQAKKIYWTDLKAMVPKKLIDGKPNESNLVIRLINGSEIHVLGLDRPERVEGIPWDHCLLDEYGNMKPDTWEAHVRPALSDRNGSADFIGAPEGRNHYFDLTERAKMDHRKKGEASSWRVWHWPSWEILPAEEIEAARSEMDHLIFRQEYGGEFIAFSGMAYYSFDERLHVGRYRDCYNPRRPLVICFDFNVSPGVAVILQELGADVFDIVPGTTITTVLGEVYIPRNSNTLRICRKIVQDWGDHQGLVVCYGDATGGSEGSAKVQGNDWELIKQGLTPHFGAGVHFNVPLKNPLERQRVNAVNSRLLSMNGDVRMVIDGKYAPYLVKDLAGVRVIDGTQGVRGSVGEIDKKSDPKLTHLSDALGYYVHKEYPVGRYFTSEDMRAMMEDEYREDTMERMKAA